MQLTWKINNLKRDEAGGVIEVFWQVIGTIAGEGDVQYGADITSKTDLTPDPESATFIPFEQLTEEVVLQWVQDAIDLDALTQSLQKKIEYEHGLNSDTTLGLPW